MWLTSTQNLEIRKTGGTVKLKTIKIKKHANEGDEEYNKILKEGEMSFQKTECGKTSVPEVERVTHFLHHTIFILAALVK